MSGDDTIRLDPADDPALVALAPGRRVFGRYTLESEVGRGGMGIVWRARDETLGETIALKFLPSEVARDAVAVDDLKEETRKARRLRHANIVSVFDFVQDGALVAVSMELVEGTTLAQWRLQQPGKVFAEKTLAPLLPQICAALDYAHTDAKVAHRDLKPANIMVTPAGTAKLTDFGIARSLTETHTRLTGRTGGTSGTLLYMSPQQLRGKRATAADDIYALGATLYELLGGKPPFFSGELTHQILNEPPEPLAERRAALAPEAPPVSRPWEKTIHACLGKNPEERPATAGAVLRGLEGGVEDPGRTEKILATPAVDATEGTGPAKRGAELQPALRREKEAEERGLKHRATPANRRPLWLALAGMAAVAALAWWYAVDYAPAQRVLDAEREKTRQAELARQTEDARLQRDREAAAEAQRREQQKIAAEQQRLEQQKIAAEQQRLAAARGGLIVSTVPAGADVAVGGFALEKSPVTIKEAKLGKYPVVIRLTGYEEQRLEAEVKENEFTTLDVTLVRLTGAAQIASAPAGLAFDFTGAGRAERGITPAKFEKLPTGDYAVTVTRPGWPEHRQTLSVGRNRTAAALAEFIGGALEITSSPSGADIFMQGRRAGTTPLKLEDQPPGPVSVEVRMAGFRRATASAVIAARQMARVPVALTPEARRIVDLGIDLLPIPAGTFTMGSPASEEGRSFDEAQHEVTIAQPFWLGKTEVTHGQWKALMGSDLQAQVRKALNDDTTYAGYGNKTIRDFYGMARDTDPTRLIGSEGDNVPMLWVSWEEAWEFCRRVNLLERAAGRLPPGYEYRLPTEAEWEYACRAGTTEATYAGPMRIRGEHNAPVLDDIAWYGGNSSVGYTGRGFNTDSWKDKQYPGGTAGPRDVATKRANAWGLHDMLGNVWEWCADQSGSNRVHRGGGWGFPARFCRSAVRFAFVPGYRSRNLGFRLALSSVP
jgi:formylglycine-generating enzyme required for sulfatase activity